MTNLEIWPETVCTYLGARDFSLLDHDKGRGDEGALSHVIYRVIGHWLQQIDGLLLRKRHTKFVVKIYIFLSHLTRLLK